MSGGAPAFASSVDAAAYVPHAAAERVLATLGEWAAAGERPVRVLRGPEGAGKSMLLAVLAARVGRYAAPVLVSAVGLDVDSLARRVLDALGAPWDGTPRVALARAVERLGERRVLLLVDDADALAPRTEMWLFDSVRRSAGGLLALLAVRDERLAADLANAFQAGTEVLAIDPALSREETEAWLRAELARGGAGAEVRARFDAPVLARIHERSGGVPGRVRREAAAILAAVAETSAAGRAAGAPGRSAAPVLSPERLAALTAGEPDCVPPPRASAARHAPHATIAPEPTRARPAPAHEGPSARTAPAPRNAPPSSIPTRLDVGSPRSTAPAAAAGRRDSLLRWLLLPAALAVAYVAGFLTAQMLETLRAAPPALVAGTGSAAAPLPVAGAPLVAPDAAPAARLPSPAVAPAADPGEPSVAPPVAALRGDDPFTPPASSLVGAGVGGEANGPGGLAGAPGVGAAPTSPVAVGPATPARADPLAQPSATDLPAVSAPPHGLVLDPGSEAPAVVAPPPAMAPEARERVRRSAEGPRKTAVDVAAEPGASILIDGRPVGSGSVSGLPLEPGPHRVEVWLPDGRVVERVVEVRGTRYRIKLR